MKASAFGGSLSLCLHKEKVTKEKVHPSTAAFEHIPVLKSPRVSTAEIRPQNNSHIPVLKQFGLLPLSAPLLGGCDGAPFEERAHPARRSLIPCFCAQDARALNPGPHQGRRVSTAEIRGKPNCLSTGTCELFGGRISAVETRGLFCTGMYKKAPLLGCPLSLVTFSLGKQRESDPPEARKPSNRAERKSYEGGKSAL